jgi:hypothetical protein
MKRRSSIVTAVFSWLILVCSSAQSWAVIANGWHIPFNNTDIGGGIYMRNPYVEIGPTTPIQIYSGIQRLNNPTFGTANQYQGIIHFKRISDNQLGTWQTASLNYDHDSGSNQYWHGEINPVTAFGSGGTSEVIQYYLELRFNTDNGGNGNYQTTYLYGGDLASLATGDVQIAANNPFTIRNRPAWIFHANNKVISGSDVQFWAKVGYITDTNNLQTKWVTNGAVYYTTDGSEPAGSLGVAGGSTTAIPFGYDHPENNAQNSGGQSIAGTSMWWTATGNGLLQNLPLGATIKYKIGFWNSSNSEEKFADHNAGTNNVTFSFVNGAVGSPTLTVSTTSTGTLNGNYTTTKVFIDEVAGTSVPVTVNFAPGEPNVNTAEIVTNLNQRDQVTVDKNGNGIEDGMEFNETETIIGSDSSYYYRSYPLSNPSLGTYTAILNANKTGAYRLTARWKVDGDTNWRWFTNHDANRRDAAVTVSPVDARNINLYEINTLTVEAKDTNGFIERSTFEDLWDAPTAPRTADGRGFSLDYLKGLGVNWLWFQPIHPPAVDGREVDPSTSNPYNPGSPYAVKNFFEINPWMSASYNGSGDVNGDTARAQGMASFQGFVSAADNKHIGVMLDAPFNHTGWDAELSPVGVELFQRDGAPTTPTTAIRDYDTRFFSKSGDYAQRATTASGDIATAPDRGDFGKWSDVKDVYFGRYDALVNTNPNDDGNYVNEGDRFYYAASGSGTSNNPENGNWTSTDFTQNGQPRNVTKQVWKYFARYPVYWLDKTRPSGHNRNSATEPGLTLAQRYDWDAQGIDGLRADFGQGLPPQLWEYIINQARSYKWNFVAMSESLDGGAVTYRSNRHFDILNENIVFPFKSAANNPDYRAIFEGRRSSYGQGLVLLNNTSHDEENYTNIFFPLMRYQVANTVDGVPMVFMGQELGITRTTGFSFYETNFGKQIAHFKKFNSMQPAWLNRLASPFGEKFLFDAFSAPAQARQASPALRGSNRWYLNRLADNQPRNEIWAVAKYEQPNVPPGLQDVFFAFVNLRTESGMSDTFNVNITQNGSNLFGIKTGRDYNVRNWSAYTGVGAGSTTRRDDWLWGAGRSGDDLLNNGVFVSLNGVPTSDSGWSTAPYEAQYLKLYDVKKPDVPTSTPQISNVYAYAIGKTVTFNWTTDPNVVPSYMVTVTLNNSTVSSFNTTTNSFTYTAPNFGDQVSITVKAVNQDSGAPSNSASSSTVTLLNPDGDQDGDGMTNLAEDTTATNPFDANSVFKILTETLPDPNHVSVTWATVPGKKYQLLSTSSLTQSFTMAAPVRTATGSTFIETVSASAPVYFRVVLVP